jgi:hypothetical protein
LEGLAHPLIFGGGASLDALAHQPHRALRGHETIDQRSQLRRVEHLASAELAPISVSRRAHLAADGATL